MANEYDITEAFAAIERELINSMFRNIKSHKLDEVAEKKEWTQWQMEELKALERYKVQNQKKYSKKFRSINNAMEEMIKLCNEYGGMDQEKEIAEAIKNGFKGFKKVSKSMQGEFFKLNERKLDALIKATIEDAEKAERAILRMANDKYRSIIFNAQVYANTGAGTYEQAIDMASKDFLSAGLNCVEYKNGARHKLSDYISMALRTANKRAYLYGEGEKRQEWGISTVIMNKRGNPCPLCLPWVGKVLIDDVWSGGSAKDGPYPLLSTAMAAGLYHPNCRDSHTTYFEGISTPPDDKFTKAELEEIDSNYRKMQKRQYAKRQAEKNERLAENSLDEENKRQYAAREEAWRESLEELESSTRSTDEHNFDLTFDSKSEEYKQKLVSLGESEEVTHSMINDTRAILKHRGGTNYEDLVYIDSTTNKHKTRRDYNVEGQVLPSEEMKEMLTNAEPHTIIAIHNHPRSSAPSIVDLETAYEAKYKYGLVACHDGKVFRYTVTKPISPQMRNIIQLRLNRLDKALDSAMRENEKEVDNILKELYNDGIKLEVI